MLLEDVLSKLNNYQKNYLTTKAKIIDSIRDLKTM